MNDSLESFLEGWRPADSTVTEQLRSWPAEAFAALLDEKAPAVHPGDPLPPLWHWFYFLDHPAQRDLGEDGHPRSGGFMPPIPDRRRMFAGGRLEQRAALRIGDVVTRRSSLADVNVKQGSSGEMAFVTVRHEMTCDGQVVAIEEQDLVYRRQPAGANRGRKASAGSSDEGTPTPSDDPWSLTLRPDPRLLFRFSALTFNGHRIHYDHRYARDVEGHPDLVVHGPLLALLLLELPRRHAPGRMAERVDFRLRRPVFCGERILAHGRLETPVCAELSATTGGAKPSITATVTLASGSSAS